MHTILYVEDNLDNIDLMEEIINRIDNAKLLTALDAEKGYELAKKEKPDLILMDINLPGMDGLEALKELQATMATRDIPVIAITARVMNEDVRAGVEAGFTDYVTKPLNVLELVQTINATLKSYSSFI